MQLELAVRTANGHESGHRQIVESLRHLAGVVESVDWERAEQLYLRALEVDDVRGTPLSALEAAGTLQMLARAYRRVGMVRAAENALVKALGVMEERLEPRHEQVGYVLRDLSEVLGEQGRIGEARAVGLRALSILQEETNLQARFVVLYLREQLMVSMRRPSEGSI